MKRQRCDKCRYWHVDAGASEQKRHKDDMLNECRRMAPSARTGDFEYLVLLWLFQHATVDDKAFADNFEDWHMSGALWPRTRGGEWCGEWEKK